MVGSGFEPDRLMELVRVTPLCIALLVLAEVLIICFRCRAMKINCSTISLRQSQLALVELRRELVTLELMHKDSTGYFRLKSGFRLNDMYISMTER